MANESIEFRFERVIWLLNMGYCGRASSDLEDLITDDPEKLIALLGMSQFVEDFGGIESFDKSILTDWLAEQDKQGFLIQFACPVFEKVNRPGLMSTSFSWGHYRTEWFYFEDIEAAIYRAKEWTKNHYENDIAASE